MCALCHEVASALQRQVGRLLAKGGPAPRLSWLAT
jgi:hypothetical protein